MEATSLALKAANRIAEELFARGFFYDRMVDDVARVIQEEINKVEIKNYEDQSTQR